MARNSHQSLTFKIMPNNTPSSKRIITGGIFLALGLVLLFDNLDVFNIRIPWYFHQWYSILILIGIFLIAVREKLGLGLTLIIIGGIFLLDDVYYLDFWDIVGFWPVVFIIIGLSLIFRRRRDGESFEKKSGDDEDYVDELAVFSGAERRITSHYFRGGKLTSIFGGTDLDLREARLASGTNILDVFVLFGGTEIKVPADMNVKVKVTAIFGGFGDDRKVIEDNPENDDSQLVIKGLVLFGGGEVK